jgi:hypothetical protein
MIIPNEYRTGKGCKKFGTWITNPAMYNDPVLHQVYMGYDFGESFAHARDILERFVDSSSVSVIVEMFSGKCPYLHGFRKVLNEESTGVDNEGVRYIAVDMAGDLLEEVNRENPWINIVPDSACSSSLIEKVGKGVVDIIVISTSSVCLLDYSDLIKHLAVCSVLLKPGGKYFTDLGEIVFINQSEETNIDWFPIEYKGVSYYTCDYVDSVNNYKGYKNCVSGLAKKDFSKTVFWNQILFITNPNLIGAIAKILGYSKVVYPKMADRNSVLLTK